MSNNVSLSLITSRIKSTIRDHDLSMERILAGASLAKSERHVLRILRIPAFFRLVKRIGASLIPSSGTAKFREVAGTEIFPPRGCAQVRAGREI